MTTSHSSTDDGRNIYPKAPAIFSFITCLLSCFNLCNNNYQKFTMPFETNKNENGTATPCKLLKGAAHGKMS